MPEDINFQNNNEVLSTPERRDAADKLWDQLLLIKKNQDFDKYGFGTYKQIVNFHRILSAIIDYSTGYHELLNVNLENFISQNMANFLVYNIPDFDPSIIKIISPESHVAHIKKEDLQMVNIIYIGELFNNFLAHANYKKTTPSTYINCYQFNSSRSSVGKIKAQLNNIVPDIPHKVVLENSLTLEDISYNEIINLLKKDGFSV